MSETSGKASAACSCGAWCARLCLRNAIQAREGGIGNKVRGNRRQNAKRRQDERRQREQRDPAEPADAPRPARTPAGGRSGNIIESGSSRSMHRTIRILNQRINLSAAPQGPPSTTDRADVKGAVAVDRLFLRTVASLRDVSAIGEPLTHARFAHGDIGAIGTGSLAATRCSKGIPSCGKARRHSE